MSPSFAIFYGISVAIALSALILAIEVFRKDVYGPSSLWLIALAGFFAFPVINITLGLAYFAYRYSEYREHNARLEEQRREADTSRDDFRDDGDPELLNEN